MGKLKRILTVALGIVFVLSLLSPICCHQDWSELFARSHHASSHSHDHDKRSACNNHVLKDLSKADILSLFNARRVPSFEIPISKWVLTNVSSPFKKYALRVIFSNKASPPIYLLNKVFLN